MLAVQAYCLAGLAWLWIGLLGKTTPHLAADVRGRPGKEAASEEQQIGALVQAGPATGTQPAKPSYIGGTKQCNFKQFK